ncbi:MAG: hypothetical protein D6B25_11720 [Desulfobulbaceae bacterium]|nr:MAG: hypothetical protein D6B25_11720 [Desulfobulbaceae bacterium]
MLRICIVVSALLLASSASAEYSCNKATYGSAEAAYQRGVEQQQEMNRRYEKLCLSNPDCVVFETKQPEVNELRGVRDQALDNYYEARDTLDWMTKNCSWKLMFSAKSFYGTVTNNISATKREFGAMEENCLWKANKIAKSWKCN